MGKRTFLSGIIVGAVIGGVVSLLNKDARNYVRDVSDQAADQVNYYVQHPSEAINNVKRTLTLVTNQIDSNTVGAMNTLDQVENTLNKVLKK